MSTTDPPPAPPDNGPKTYAIDVRVFLAAITATMALAFGAGLSFGPTHLPPSPNFSPTTPTLSSSNRAEILNERHVNLVQPSLEDLGGGAVQYNPKSQHERVGEENAETEYMPAGQHLLVDIQRVEEAFLNSEERLADAMVRSVEAAGLTMLSYHCHALQPAGVSCVGVLLESHISFHTWPQEGVITLDLFTCGSKPLLPVIPDLERLFGVPRIDPETGELGKSKTQWSHELRGFRIEGPNSENHLDSKTDLAFWIMSVLQYEVKDQIVSTVTAHQRIDIWDMLDTDDTPSNDDAIRHNLTVGDPRWLTAEIATPDRYIFLNGAVMNLRDTSLELYEALVHPAMFTHPNPTNVAIVGGGHGAALREVLKHKDVKSATIIEVDEELVTIAREHLFYLNECDSFVGGTKDCYDDPRVTAAHQDGKEWFTAHNADESQEKIDVVILDMHDVRATPTPTEHHFTDPEFWDSILTSLADDGIMAIRIGNAEHIHNPRASIGVSAKREEMMVILEEHPATEAIFLYEEAHCGFSVPLSFLIVCKNSSCRKRWYASADATDTDIYSRLSESVDTEPVLSHYDGSTQENFQYTPIAWETVYCRRDPMPFECNYRGLDVSKSAYEFDTDDVNESSFEIRTTEVDGETRTGIYATEDIAAGSYIMPYDLASSFSASQDVLDNLKANTEIDGTGGVTVIEDFLEYIEENGHATMHDGRELTYVEIGATFMIRKTEDDDEVNVGRWMPEHPGGKKPTYSPVYERHTISFDVFMVATADISEGDELVKHVNLWN